MKFPTELWTNEQAKDLAQSICDAFPDQAIILTDKLTNSIYLNSAAETLLEDRAESLVNRVAASLIGAGEKENAPAGFNDALLGISPPWRGMIAPHIDKPDVLFFAEASAIQDPPDLICGIIRISPTAQVRQ